MSALHHGLAMTGYAGYIWSAYGLVFGVFVGNLIHIRWRGRRIHRALRTELNRR